MEREPQKKGLREYDLGLTNSIILADLLDIEKLFRLNPHWFIDELVEEHGDFSARLRDYVSDREFRLRGRYSAAADRLRLDFEDGPLRSLSLFFRGGKLHGTLELRDAGADEECEHYTLLWLRGIREYLRLYRVNTPARRFFRFIMNRMVLRMNPSQRKICLMLIRLTLVEIVVILVIVVGYVVFVL